MLPHNRLRRQEVEGTLTSDGFTVVEEPDGRVMYNRNTYPGVDIILDYNEDGTIAREVVLAALAEEGIHDIEFP